MGKIKSILAAAFIALGSFAPVANVAIPAVALTACVTSKVSKAVTSIRDQEKQVKLALDAWADWSVAQGFRIDKITDKSAQSLALSALSAKEARVDAALKNYQAVALPTKARILAALANDSDPAPADMIAAGNSFIALTQTLSK